MRSNGAAGRKAPRCAEVARTLTGIRDGWRFEAGAKNPAFIPDFAALSFLKCIKREIKLELKGSKTEKNLMAAFAGESQARNKYDYFASKPKFQTAG